MKQILINILLIATIGCGQSRTTGVKPKIQYPSKGLELNQNVKKNVKPKVINRDSLSVGYILDSLINNPDLSFSKRPVVYKDTFVSNNLASVLFRKNDNKTGPNKYKYYTDEYGNNYIDIHFAEHTVEMSLMFYSDSIFAFGSGEIGIFVDLKTKLYMSFGTIVSGRLPFKGCNDRFYILEEDLFAVAFCEKYYGPEKGIREVSKVINSENVSYEVENSRFIGMSYYDLTCKDVLQMKKEIEKNKLVVLKGKATPMRTYTALPEPPWVIYARIK